MARKTSTKAAETAPKVNEKELTKGQRRKLIALRKSVGEGIGTEAFAKWHATQQTEPKVSRDKNAEQIVSALEQLVEAKKLRIPRGGYHVKRGRGRVIVTRPESSG